MSLPHSGRSRSPQHIANTNFVFQDKEMRKTILSFFIGALAVSAWLNVSADSRYLPTVRKDGKECYYYSVDKGESVYGILSRFGWDADTFMLYNPKSLELKKGQVVYYPCESVKDESVKEIAAQDLPAFLSAKDHTSDTSAKPELSHSNQTALVDVNALPVELYTVSDGDTFGSIVGKYHTSVSQLFKDNPGLTPDNLTSELVIKVRPGSDMANAELKDVIEKVYTHSKKYKAAQNDTWSSVAMHHGLDTAVLKRSNPDVHVLRKGMRITIPQFKDTVVSKMVPTVDPREHTPVGIRSIYKETRGSEFYNDSRNICVTVLVGTDAASKKREIDFLRGFMLGMDGVVSSPRHVTLRAVEIDDNTSLEKAIASGALKEADMLVCATDKDFPNNLAEYCATENIMLLNVFDAKTDISQTSPHGIQLLPPSDYFYNRISDFLTRVMPDRTYLYVGGGMPDGESLSAALLERLRTSETAKVVMLEDVAALEAYDFQPSLSYAVISDAGTKDDINATLNALESIVDKHPKMPLTVIGRPNWMVYAKSMEALLRKLDTYIPSRFMFDDDSAQSKQLEKDYRSYYKEAPVKSMPSYAAMGFDVARYFVTQYLATGGDLNYAKPAEALVQLEFRPERTDMWSGFVNKCVYLLHFTPFSTTDKIRL